MDDIKETLFTLISLVLLVLLIIGGFFGIYAGYAKLNLWASSIRGESQLREAEWNRKIIVREAESKKDAAIMLAQAEIERAKGVAQANKIIGNSLKGNDDYLRYLWIDSLQHTQDKVIYIPTEAGLPILEANRSK
jgi:regulator of protease activity HflC (stomatin/prohibitin superfamily)